MESYSYVKGSCGSDFAVFFASIYMKLRLLSGAYRVDNSNGRGNDIFTGTQESKRRDKRL